MQLAPRTRQQMDGGYCFLPTGSGDLGGGVSLFTQMRMEDGGGGCSAVRALPTRCPEPGRLQHGERAAQPGHTAPSSTEPGGGGPLTAARGPVLCGTAGLVRDKHQVSHMVAGG